ncbi:hypothetical protein NDU88_003402 [Pleurodeles waltl]|uniref:Reverse transcriptase domain-containing protein n=1 Tax=Pleurodeles waltl TaxID=8319 RepID=A0AAV7W2A1_PLEWA|nr:hypothetical protein NDU88_003402 [Pleurodeles waltl]
MISLRAELLGPDGLPADLYKTFATALAPHLLYVFEQSVQEGSLLISQNEALLVSLPKPRKDPMELGSYHPLAMLNTDYKMLAKMIVARLAPMVPDLVHADQNGFVPAQDTSHNIRRLFCVMHYSTREWQIVGCLVLDLEKAFDSLEWPCLFGVLRQLGLEPLFLRMIKLLYTSPRVQVRTSGGISEPVEVRRGTRQG